MRIFSPVQVSAAVLAAALIATEFFAATTGLMWFAGEVPCTLTGAERLAAAFVCASLVFAAVEGLSARLAGLLLLQALVGLWLCARHLVSQGSGDVAQGFGSTVLGLHGYAWSAFVFVAVLLWLAAAWIFSGENARRQEACVSRPGRVAAGVAAVVLLMNAGTALVVNGPPPFAGVGIPEHWTLSSVPQRWSASFWQRLRQPPTLFVRPFAAQPCNEESGDSPQAGPVSPTAPTVRPIERQSVPMPFESNALPRAFAWDPEKERFGWVTDQHEAAFTDRTMHRVTARAAVDTVNGQTLDAVAGVVWLKERFIVAAQNKTLWALESAYGAAAGKGEGLLRSTGNVRLSWERARYAVRTVRARDAFVGALAADEESLFMMTLPTRAAPQTVLVTLDGTDLMPVAERPLAAAPGVEIKAGRSLHEYRITAAVWAQQRILAWCRRYSSLLTIDPHSARVTMVRGLEGVGDVLSMTVRDDRLLLLEKRPEGLATAAFALNAFLGGVP